MYPLDRPKRYKTLVLSGRCSLRPPGSRHNHRGWMMSHSPAPSYPLDSPCSRQSLCGGVKSRRCLKRRTHIEVLVNMCVSPTLELRGNASYDVGVYTWSACWHGLGSNNQIRIRPFGSPRPQQRAMHVCTSHHTKFCPPTLSQPCLTVSRARISVDTIPVGHALHCPTLVRPRAPL